MTDPFRTAALPQDRSGSAGDRHVEDVTDGGRVVCTVLRASLAPDATQFFTREDSSLQVGMVVHPAGHVIPRHRHVPIAREITETGEVLVVQRGSCTVELFTASGELLHEVELGRGDVLILSGAAHRFTMHEDTVLLEVKQGPYAGPAEKEIF